MSTHGQSRGAASSSERGADDRSVLQIAKKVAATVGADFFNAIAKHLAKALSADCVLFGEFTGGGMEMVRTLGACLDGHPTTFQYELAGGAAAEVAVGKSCMCRSSAASRFPHDEVLRSVGAQAVIAAPLEDTQRGVLGLIMVLYRRPVASFRV